MNHFEPLLPNAVKVRRNHMGNGVLRSLFLHIAVQPLELFNIWPNCLQLLVSRSAIIQIGGIAAVNSGALLTQLHKVKLLRDGAVLAAFQQIPVLNRVLDIAKQPWFCSRIIFIHIDGAAFQYVAVPFHNQINRRFHQWVTGTEQVSDRRTRKIAQVLIEAYALISLQHGLAGSDDAVAAADCIRHAQNLVAALLPWAYFSAQQPECF